MKNESTGPLFYGVYTHTADPRIPPNQVRCHYVKFDTYYFDLEEFQGMSLKIMDSNLWEPRKITELVCQPDESGRSPIPFIAWNTIKFDESLASEGVRQILTYSNQTFKVLSVSSAQEQAFFIEKWIELKLP